MNFEKIIICDLESSCWRTKEESNKNKSEIIEIGVALLNLKTGLVEKSHGYIIKPIVSTISDFCTELTTLTQEDVNKGISYKEACDALVKDFDSQNIPWASYGQYDFNMLERQSKDRNVRNPFSNQYINIKLLFSLMDSQNRQMGMAKALTALGYKLEGTHHRGVDDAINIAKIAHHLLGN